MSSPADMSPDEHHAEARRLLGIARRPIVTGAPIGFSTHVEVVALAQLHATLALYRCVRYEGSGDDE